MPEFLEHHPGLLFVGATLLPIASFVLILLSFAVRTYFRKSPQGSTGEMVFQLFGGPKPGRGPAYVATGAIGLAFVLSLTGFILYASGHAAHESEEQRLEHQIRHLRDERAHEGENPALAKQIHDAEDKLQHLKGEWQGQVTWAAVDPKTSEIRTLEKEIAALKGDKAKLTKAEEERLHEKEDLLRQAREHRPGTMLTLGYRIDMLSALMFVMVTLIATLIHVFSMGYMAEEMDVMVTDHQVHTAEGHLHRRGRYGRFFLYLSLFCFSMLNLVLADNLFQVFLSWELVGVCSYLLIGFYFERQSASNAANKAFITNRIGDAGFIIGLLILWTYVGTFNFEEIFQRLRAPVVDSHNSASTLAQQIVRAEPVPDPKLPGVYQVVAPDKSITATTQAVLWPIDPEHLHKLDSRDKETGNIKYKRVVAPPGGDLDEEPANRMGVMPYWMLVAAGLGIFLGCVGKSAQFPLQVWLPDAMEGPTPVSALIHAATMVAAGVYLVGRCFPLFTMEALLVIAYTGALTCFMAATIALVMTDIKKVLAYSTVSQLGMMMLALGIGGWVAGLFHLITHAFFKALLFLGSGSVIYGCHHEQEMTRMGGLYPKMRITALTMLAGVLAIAGTPLFSGWYSKDAIMVQAMGFVIVNKQHFLLFLLPLVTAGLTTFYMFRMWFMTFAGKPRDHHVHEEAHESPWLMTVPLMVLAFFSVTVAWGWPVYDAEASWLEHQIHHAQPQSVMADFGIVKGVDKRWDPKGGDSQTGAYVATWREWKLDLQRLEQEEHRVRAEAHHYHTLTGLIVLGVVILAFALAYCVYYLNLLDPAEAREQFPGVYDFLLNKWYFDAIYSALLVRPALTVAHWCRIFDSKVIDGVVDGTAKVTVATARGSGRFDNGIIDGLVNVIADACWSVGAWLRNVQTGYLRSYVVFLVLAAVGIWVVLTSLLGAK
jgi:NADH-quinone oxidoreductase subunit L